MLASAPIIHYVSNKFYNIYKMTCSTVTSKYICVVLLKGENRMHYNHIVIGAGSMGMAAGYFLAKEKFNSSVDFWLYFWGKKAFSAGEKAFFKML